MSCCNLNSILYFWFMVLWIWNFNLLSVFCNSPIGNIPSCTDNGSSPCQKQSLKFICYFTNWSTNRTGHSRFKVADIPDHTPCTHIVYSFAVLNPKTLTMELSIPKIDEGEVNLYQQVTSLRSKGIKVSIALGGWTDSKEGSKYSNMINDGFARTNFVHHAVTFLRRYNFDGIDLDWEFPRCWWGNCTAGPISDMNNFANLVQELKMAFNFYGLLVSVAVSGDRRIATQAYDMARIGKYADWVGLMTYDLHVHPATSGKTGHHSPYMGPHPNTVDAIDLWMSHGVLASSLIMGIPLYGRSFTLEDVTVHGVGAPAKFGKPGKFTEEQGFLAYFEFCTGWIFKDVAGVGSYAVKDDQWVSFNNLGIIGEKMKHILQYRLGGVMLWSLDLDDFNGEFCNQGRYPLITAMKNALLSSNNNSSL